MKIMTLSSNVVPSPNNIFSSFENLLPPDAEVFFLAPYDGPSECSSLASCSLSLLLDDPLIIVVVLVPKCFIVEFLG